MKQFILVINPGSTSTKIALFENEEEKLKNNLEHTVVELSKFTSIIEQEEFRTEAILDFLQNNDIELSTLSAVVGRGGMLTPVNSGAYRVNDRMIEVLTNNPVGQHASNLGALIAYKIAQPLGIPAYIYDAVAVDEMEPIAKITGLEEIKRKSLVHTLNMRAAAIKTAEKQKVSLNEVNYIVVHIGGGCSMSLLSKGKMVDIVSDDEGPMSPERSGRIPALQLIDQCFSGQKHNTMLKKIRGQGGLLSHLGTNSALEVENKISAGDEKAKMIYYAMSYQIAKGIGELATAVFGKVDRIIITGGIAYSMMLTNWIKERVGFIAPIEIVPGENEMESLAKGALRVLKGQEDAQNF